ncbi:beta-propeller domain-containing protein [Bacillus sp. 2205SS5-2]|uniref:beta-propeller domain-containing protein n=1 Tax=Bacillus sp. 2205SS5-2 TaxID=3109031 RepID=UPI003007C5CD
MRKTIWVLSSIILLISMAVWIYFQPDKLTLQAKTSLEEDGMVVLQNQIWEIDFSSSVDELSLTERSIYATNEQGENVPVSLELVENGKKLIVFPPENGYDLESNLYTLHITNAVKSISGSNLEDEIEIPFNVMPELPTIKSEQVLKNYFLPALKKQRSQQQQFFKEDTTMQRAEAQTSSADESSNESGNNYSETNNQVQGVDEADIVKTDGNYIYQLANQSLVITDTHDPQNLSIASKTSFDNGFSARELFLDGDILVVIGDRWEMQEQEVIAQSSSSMPDDRMHFNGMTYAYLYDVSNRSEPTLMREIGLEGNYVTSRKINGYVYLVAQQYPNFWLLEEKEEIDLRPRFFDSEQGSTVQTIDYSNIKYFPGSEETNITLLTAINIKEPQVKVNIETYLGSGHEVYMSRDNLYLSIPKYTDVSDGHMQSPDTEIYKFAVRGMNIHFVSKGKINGTILNQFSMDERDGHLRVATTKGLAWKEGDPSTNHLYILDENMKQVGAVENLAKGERIYSVRFMEGKAYVVTFKQVDPLFVIDVSDPKAPTVLGELKIPGFSTYLHPYDENHLIGFGFETTLVKDDKQLNSPPRVLTGGMKISLFDITDFQNPKEQATEVIGGRGTYSYMLHDHKALLHHKKNDLFAFPVSVYHEKEGSLYEQELDYQGALVYEISPTKGIKQQATLTFNDQRLDGGPEKDMYENWENEIQRLLYINDDLFTLSSSKIGSYDLATFEEQDILELDIK